MISGTASSTGKHDLAVVLHPLGVAARFGVHRPHLSSVSAITTPWLPSAAT